MSRTAVTLQKSMKMKSSLLDRGRRINLMVVILIAKNPGLIGKHVLAASGMTKLITSISLLN
jgi:hypothetical protein